MGLISCAKKYPVSTFHPKNPALQDSILVFNVFNQDCELVSQLPIVFYMFILHERVSFVNIDKGHIQNSFSDNRSISPVFLWHFLIFTVVGNKENFLKKFFKTSSKLLYVVL